MLDPTVRETGGVSTVPLLQTTSRLESLQAALALADRLPQLADDALFADSLPHFLEDSDYQFVVDRDEESEEPSALALLRLYRTPFDEKVVVAVEALWLDDGEEAQRRFWQQLFGRFGAAFKGICVTPRSVADVEVLDRLQAAGELDEALVRNASLILEPLGAPGLYSAFGDGPPGRTIDTTCLCLYSMAGEPAAAGLTLYRGEGRLEWEGHWRYESLEQLAAALVRDGFPARATGSFGGTVREQLCHQGYVDSATVSLTASADVGAVYATGSGARPGVVFAIDPAGLRETGEVYDSYATMVRYCNWIGPDVFDALRAIVRSFGADRDGLRRAGAFLADADARAQRAALVLPTPPPASLVTPEAAEQAALAGVPAGLLERLHDDLRGFWVSRLGGGALMLASTADGDLVETPMEAYVYIGAFEQAQPQLEAAYEGRLAHGGDPGWDLVPLGYIAKTCRDEEFFSTGGIDPRCIVGATIVDERRRPVRHLDVDLLRRDGAPSAA